MGKFVVTFKKIVYFNLHVDLSSGGYGTFLLKQTDPKATGYDRVWEYVNDDITVLCKRIGNTVDSWALVYYVGTFAEYFIEFRGEDPWNIIEGSFIYTADKKFDPVITKVSPIPVAKYYNVLVDFKGTYAANYGQETFTLTLEDTSKTGMDREWSYLKKITNDDGSWESRSVSLKKGISDKSVWNLTYVFAFDDGDRHAATVVWDGIIDCENPWEATSDQISSTDSDKPKLSGIPVSE
jgi:hypothetical protein